jgi:hypothetical protein
MGRLDAGANCPLPLSSSLLNPTLIFDKLFSALLGAPVPLLQVSHAFPGEAGVSKDRIHRVACLRSLSSGKPVMAPLSLGKRCSPPDSLRLDPAWLEVIMVVTSRNNTR